MVKIVCISDTHAQAHCMNPLPEGDILVHSGDFSGKGDFRDAEVFARWFLAQTHRHKVLVPGNHDGQFEKYEAVSRSYFPGVHVLIDQAVILEGLKFYGSPWTPEFCGWHYMKPRGAQLANVWAKIPLDTDVLVTHGPPYGIRDRVPRAPTALDPEQDPGNFVHVGCEELRRRVQVVRPQLHIFGHVHFSYGLDLVDGTIFANSAICTEGYKPRNKPIVVEL